jgi:hypothetical protein
MWLRGRWGGGGVCLASSAYQGPRIPMKGGNDSPLSDRG